MKKILMSLLLVAPGAWAEDKPAELPGMAEAASKAAANAAQNDSQSDPAGAQAQPSAQKSQESPPPTGENGQLPTEVVIRGSDSGNKVDAQKPPLSIEMDAFESIRPTLEPDEALLLADSPHAVGWWRTHPEFLYRERVVQPWRTTFSDRSGIVFNILEQLRQVLQRPVDPKEARGYQWSLTIADEEGRVFQQYDGSKDPPEELVWNGQNDQGEWIKAGRSYSAIYKFVDPQGGERTKPGKPLQFTGIVHQESDGLYVSLDSTVLFGPNKSSRELEKNAPPLMRSAADLIKRRFSGVPLRVSANASTKELAETQANQVRDYLIKELMILPQNIGLESSHASYSEQRVDLVLLNR